MVDVNYNGVDRDDDSNINSIDGSECHNATITHAKQMIDIMI